MRNLALATLALLPALTLGACAGTGTETSTASTPGGRDMARLERECDARGGILIPSGRLSGEPALDNFCSIRGASTPAP